MGKNKRNFRFILSAMLVFQVAMFASLSSKAHAGGKIDLGDNRFLNIGMGLRSSISTAENAAPNGTSNSKNFSLENMRLYMSGQLYDNITFEFNTDYESGTSEDLRVLDAVIKFAFSETFNIWAGRFLPPSDRSNLDGPYYLNAWDFPFVQKYPAIFAGRDDGLAIWGQTGGGMFKYQMGVFEGKGTAPVSAQTGTIPFTPTGGTPTTLPVLGAVSGPNQDDNPLFAGRLTLNLLDPEPGYYNSSTYYGGKDIAAIGLVGMYQEDAVGTAGAAGDFTGWNIDLLLEKDLGGSGVATLEGAYYDYDGDGKALAPSSGDGSEGKGFFALTSFLLPNKVGSGSYAGQLQPMVRYQKFENEGMVTGEHTRTDIGLSHIMDGHNARLTLTYSMDDPASGPDADIVKLGFQFQI
ncbi:MAG: hypothetical protein GXO96_02160 [Nitrospirae bacterium]|nr:hypothetical protein [Candidatus Manganitrophaceae bacterium]